MIWRLIDEEGVTHYNGAPTVQLMVVNHPRAHRVERPVTVLVAAAPPSPTLFARMAELNFRVVHVYGLTETYGPITVCAGQAEWRRCPRRAGRACSPARARRTRRPISCASSTRTMNDVPRDGETMGEVVMRGNNVMRGYFDDDEATAKAFRGGWFHSGDLAVWHPGRQRRAARPRQGHHHLGRREHLLDRGRAGRRRPPGGARVRRRRDPARALGRAPKAFVTLKEGATATAEEIVAFRRERLAHYKCPDAVEFGPLPKTSTGKVQKFVLREKEWAGHESRIGAA